MLAPRATVAVTSPRAVVVEGFSAMLSRHGERIQVIDVPRSAHDEEPDVVLYDVLSLVGADGPVLDELVRRTSSVVYAVGDDVRPDLVGQALALGADGFFPLGVTEAELLEAVDSAVAGWQEGDAGPDPVMGAVGSDARARVLGHHVGLSEREARVLRLVAQGLSNDEIARQDFLSINSVKTYIRTGYRKIGATNRTQAVVWAMRHGFATDEESAVG